MQGACGPAGGIQSRFMAAALGSASDPAEDVYVKVNTMTTVWLRAAFSVMAVLGAAAGLSAPAHANCDWYVKTSLEQQQRNLKLKCGLSGAEWSVDKGAHAAWCASVSPDASRSTAQKREAELAKCAAK